MVGDFLRELLAECRSRGIKLVAMVAHTANRYIYRLHSEWAQRNACGEVILLEHVPRRVRDYEPEWPQICINSPYIEVLKREVEEVASMGVDGVFLDSFRYQPDYERACYCRYCIERFLREHGYEPPREPSWSDSRWIELWEWRYRVVVEKLRELHRVAKSVNPSAVFMYNSHPGGWAGRTNRVVEMARNILDAVFAECSEADHQPPGFITEMVKLTRAMLGHDPRKKVWASRNYFHMYRTVAPTTPLAIRQGVREAVLGGGDPWVLLFSSSLVQDPSALKAIEEVFSEMERLEEYLAGAEPLTYLGIVVSNEVRDLWTRGRPEPYVDEIRGFYYAAVHSHVPTQFVALRDLADPRIRSMFKVLALPSTACMGREAVDGVRRFVEEGGGVVASYAVSIAGERCIELNEIELSDVLGARLRTIVEAPWSYMVVEKREHELFRGVESRTVLVGDMSYEFAESRVEEGMAWFVGVEPVDSEVLARMAMPVSGYGFEYTLGRSPPAMGAETRWPAILARSSAIYFSWQVGRHYWRIGLPTYRNLIVNAVEYAAREEPPIVVRGPETVAVEPFRQGERLVIHLLNHTYNQRILAMSIGATKQPLPGYSTVNAVHPPREVVPIDGLEIGVKGVEKARAYEALSGRELMLVERGDRVWVEVPKLIEYAVVVIEPRA